MQKRRGSVIEGDGDGDPLADSSCFDFPQLGESYVHTNQTENPASHRQTQSRDGTAQHEIEATQGALSKIPVSYVIVIPAAP